MGKELRSAIAGFSTPPIYEEPVGVPDLDQGTVVAVASRVVDLAEDREPGHANRVAFVGKQLAEHLGLTAEEIEDSYFACLLHDVGKILQPQEQKVVRGPELLASQLLTVSEIVAGLGLREPVATAVAEHGRYGWLAPRGGDPVEPSSMVARIVAAADRLDSIAASGRSALLVRRRGPEIARSMASDGFGDEIAEALGELVSVDPFWIGYYDNDLLVELTKSQVGTPFQGESVVEAFSVLADLVDARNGHPGGRARRVGNLAREVALGLGEPEGKAQLIRLAALLQDIGTLGVSTSYVRKPDLLPIDELADIQNHPVLARDILSELPGLGVVAWWVACHHERIDGRGYPVGFAGEEVPLEAQIIGLCETFDAIISDRPHHLAMSEADAIKVLAGLAGSRFVPELVRAFSAVMRAL